MNVVVGYYKNSFVEKWYFFSVEIDCLVGLFLAPTSSSNATFIRQLLETFLLVRVYCPPISNTYLSKTWFIELIKIVKLLCNSISNIFFVNVVILFDGFYFLFVILMFVMKFFPLWILLMFLLRWRIFHKNLICCYFVPHESS